MRVIFYSSLLVLLLLLNSCGVGAAPSAAQPTLPAPTNGAAQATAQPDPTRAPTTAPEPPSAPPTNLPPTAAPQPSAQTADMASVIVTYRKTGGIAGVDETLIVRAGGALELQSRRGGNKTAQATPAELSKLQQLLASPEFAQLQARYPASGADLFTYSISVGGQSQPTVVAMDGAQLPPVLSQTIDALNQLAAQAK